MTATAQSAIAVIECRHDAVLRDAWEGKLGLPYCNRNEKMRGISGRGLS
jgi:hypothetical protein